MPDGGEQVIIRVVDDIHAVPASAWDACAGPDNPFVSHAFLSALEDSGSVSAERGWLPQHLVLEGEDGQIRGCAPLYLKGHSYGEYVFDWGWADAYERAGGRYYPKLQAAIPFTPVTGPRLLVAPDADPPAVRAALIRGLESVTDRHGVVTAHVTFPTEAEWHALGQAGWLQRTGQQYHWQNPGYGSFADFLAALNARKRKAIKKERRQVAEAGVQLRVLTGGALEPHHWDLFYRFYRNTTDRKWGAAYLTRRFFTLLGGRMAERVALVVAEADGRMVAGALNLIGKDTLYGRNWGCAEHFKFLHFEACYYQAMEFAIARGLRTVEAGAQGEHKLQRGYLPTPTFSAHLIRDPALKRAVADFLSREAAYVAFEMEALSEASPFRRTQPGP
ncbi:MAG: GNAT family N-acetyltransferase [Alphaproteobacteria bacterium]|jgi:predicted N-acyltransferase|nr:GNAT family N-acetyltransferase [Alphaproteobacteria bacterium]